MFYLEKSHVPFDSLDEEAMDKATALGENIMLESNVVYRPSKEDDVEIVRYPVNAFTDATSDHEAHAEEEKFKPKELHSGKTLFNGQTLLYEADRLREVAAIRGVVTFDEFAKFHRRLIPLLEELGISLDPDDERKARLEAEG